MRSKRMRLIGTPIAPSSCGTNSQPKGQGDRKWRAATNQNTPRSRSVKLSTSKKATKSAECPKKKPSDAHGRRSTKWIAAARNQADLVVVKQLTKSPHARAEGKAARQRQRGQRRRALLQPRKQREHASVMNL